MTHTRGGNGKYEDFEGLRERAVALRREGLSLRQIRDELKIFNNDILNQLVKGEPPPEWTKRPNAKDGLREKARELRLQGWTYDQIQVALSFSTDGIIAKQNLVTLEDDKKLFPPDHAVPVVRTDFLPGAADAFKATINKISAAITV